jgi:hypothetical protein
MAEMVRRRPTRAPVRVRIYAAPDGEDLALSLLEQIAAMHAFGPMLRDRLAPIPRWIAKNADQEMMLELIVVELDGSTGDIHQLEAEYKEMPLIVASAA